MVPFVKTRDGLDIYIAGEMKSVAPDHVNYDEIVNLATSLDCDEKELLKLIDVAASILKYSEKALKVEGDVVTYKDYPISRSLTRRILELLKEDMPVTVFVNFLDNLYKNPSNRAVEELYGFLEANNIPLTADGCFLAYKKITHDYKDIYSKSFNNKVGEIVKMDRNQVNEDKEQTCSHGLHVASFDYMDCYGGRGKDADDRIVICRINPKDVVSVPVDYHNAKMRVCEYEVVGEIPNDGVTKLANKLSSSLSADEFRALCDRVRKDFVKAFDLESTPSYSEIVFDPTDNKFTTVHAEAFLKAVEKAYNLVEGSHEYFVGEDLSVAKIVQWIIKAEAVEINLDEPDVKADVEDDE